MKIALLTNEIPPIVYGGVATWILNFLDMFKDDPDIEVIPVFLAHLDEPPTDFPERYPGIRIIHGPQDIEKIFQDIDITVNNLWVAFDTTKAIKDRYPEKRMISVCHSLIKMEHLTNLGSDTTKSFYEQEITFQYSDAVVLISRAELGHYTSFGYDKYDAEPVVIYNSYTPKLDEIDWRPNYDSNDIGYIGRHVPRKRPDLPILAVERSNRNDVRVFNMGVDYRGETGNPFWEEMGRKHPKQLVIIPFSSNEETVHFYWNSVGANCITGVYEPFGYTMCETLDRRVPAIVQDIDGPKEICELVKDSVFEYHVDQDFDKDIQNFMESIIRFWDTHPDDRASMANRARNALDGFRPKIIREEWKKVFSGSETRTQGQFSISEIEKRKKQTQREERSEQIYGYSKAN